MSDHRVPGIPGTSGFTGKVALVTGAGQGIGEAVVRTLFRLGATVAATDVQAKAVAALAAELDPETGRAPSAGDGAVRAYELDVTDPAAVDRTVERIGRELGPIDILVNVAGVLRAAPVAELTDEDWAATFAVNVQGVFFTSRSVVPGMAARGAGSVITVASNAAGIPRTGMAAYAASKAAAVMFTKCLGLEYARSGVRCNIVAPGSTDTPMQWALWTDPQAPARVLEGDLASYRTGIPLGRIADPQDIADAVAFLASDQARHITMQDLYVDGGATLR
ncbi:2,3-dihydro-2,3-dihydroxybenzoate dehydrogenase [Streptomyces virginiae]|uniref:2,3-dihydro-2,3-dihydroxybenzoate dehydrogenase n=1 Tax=Streptomyces TaxID=1883 RepID=UPI000524304A|nr:MULTISPECIES: 2,3-dihydro-2,3-dihydroxybenzoate dehydrogenase [Streptomyces]MCX4718903.1 2,3-dihydro-2,3-dihydroxybenzoate dehydrogenase [Streptomyces virginiae]MCX5276544.1 2,3-dihydro-2,3-dihydroxybenzoate dehydrogenase [Streptomyces virginiae]MYV72595.1 2,3-dihydro-2,3-dihydroxybenzoate dehydrogenase [Streptomyces sp. SID1046]